MSEIIYEKHPVSVERKAELRAQGFKILDARYAPKADEVESHAKPKVTRRRKAK